MGTLILGVMLAILAAMLVTATIVKIKVRPKMQARLHAQRRATDNDEGQVSVMAWKEAINMGIFVGLALGALLALTNMIFVNDRWFTRLMNSVGIFLLFGGLPALIFYFGMGYSLGMVYSGTMRRERALSAGAGSRYGVNVQKTHTVDNTRGQVLDRLEDSNKRGPLVLLNQMDSQAAIEAETKRRSDKPWNLNGWRCADEDRGMIVGVPGAGKTTFLIAQLVDWMATGRSFVATDIKPEIWSILKENGLFERFGYTDHVINPTCAAAKRLNLFSEIEDDADLNEVLAVFIPMGEGDSAVFNDNARRLLKAVLSHLGEQASLPAARDFIMEAGTVPDLLDILKQSPKKSVQRIAFEVKNTSVNDRLLASIMTAMSRAFEFMDDDRINAAISASDFSMRDVLMQPRQAVFLQYEQKYKASLATLFGATVAYTLRLLQANASAREHAVLVALDEIINAAPIPKFSESLNTMRSARMPLMMYLQSIEGLNRLYGPMASEVFLGSADLKVIFRLNDNATAEYISAQLGDTEQRAYNMSQSDNESRGGTDRTATRNHSAGTSVGYTSSTARIFDAAEILGLEPQKAIVLYRGSGARFTMPSYWKDYPMPARAAVEARPQAVKSEAMELA